MDTIGNWYADDTNLYSIGKTVNEIQTKLANGVRALNPWCRINNLGVGFVKPPCMLVSTSQNRSHLNRCDLHV